MPRKIKKIYDTILPKDCPHRVLVYRNKKQDIWSIVKRKTNLLECHANELWIYNPRFIVRANGRIWVRKNKKFKPHAFVSGMLCGPDPSHKKKLREIIYDAYTMIEFTYSDDPDTWVFSARYVECRKDGTIWIAK